jgi:hypothetical protein
MLHLPHSPGAESIAMAFNSARLELALNNIETLRAAEVSVMSAADTLVVPVCTGAVMAAWQPLW